MYRRNIETCIRDALLDTPVVLLNGARQTGKSTLVLKLASAAGLSGGPLVAARLSGADARTAARTILIPLLAPALVAAWVIVFLFGFHELTMSSLLYSPGSETLAVVVLNLQQLGDPGATAALAVLLTGAVVAIGFAGCGIWKAVGRR